MGPFGIGEILMIAAILAIVFSASRMGQLGNALGKFVHSFKKASKGEAFGDVTASKKRERGAEAAQGVDGSVKKP